MAHAENVTSITPRGTGRRKVPRSVRERQMLDVAERAFAERGFHAASVDAIAERAGISKPMVYAYFGSKEGLYLACMERARRRLFESIDEGADAGAAPDEQLWLGLLAFFTFVDEQRDSWAVLFGEATTGGGLFAEEATRIRGQIARLVAQLLGESVAETGGDESRLEATGPLAYALVGAAESLAHWWRDHPGEPKESIARVLMNLAWMGFGDLRRGRTWRGAASSPGLGAGIR